MGKRTQIGQALVIVVGLLLAGAMIVQEGNKHAAPAAWVGASLATRSYSNCNCGYGNCGCAPIGTPQITFSAPTPVAPTLRPYSTLVPPTVILATPYSPLTAVPLQTIGPAQPTATIRPTVTSLPTVTTAPTWAPRATPTDLKTTPLAATPTRTPTRTPLATVTMGPCGPEWDMPRDVAPNTVVALEYTASTPYANVAIRTAPLSNAATYQYVIAGGGSYTWGFNWLTPASAGNYVLTFYRDNSTPVTSCYIRVSRSAPTSTPIAITTPTPVPVIPTLTPGTPIPTLTPNATMTPTPLPATQTPWVVTATP